MRKLFLIIFCLFSSIAFSSELIRSWKCNELKVHMFNDDTFQVGDLIYEIEYCEDCLLLKIGDAVFLVVNKEPDGNIRISNYNDPKDFKYFVKCD